MSVAVLKRASIHMDQLIHVFFAMMKDKTEEFKKLLRSLNAIKSNQGSNGSKLNAKILPSSLSSSSSKNKKSTVHLQFSSQIQKLVDTITKMKDFLLDHRKDYINLYSPLISQASSMTDTERDQIDKEVYTFMKQSNEVIKSLKIAVSNGGALLSAQMKTHQFAVISLIEDYLKAVCDIYSQQKAIRVRRAFEKQRMSRLEWAFSNKRRHSDPEPHLSVDSVENKKDDPPPRALLKFINDFQLETENIELTREELQIYEKENEHIFAEMNALNDEVRQIEGKVIEIARLQEIFTEKVLQQEQDLNRLSDTVIGTTENIRGGNEQLREAMKKNAGFRVWILFFIITLAFTILFLDWYNP